MKFLKKPSNKIGFLLQLGYFKATAKFYTQNQFRPSDIKYVSKLFACTVNIKDYKEKTAQNHQKKILNLLDWDPFDDKAMAHISAFSESKVQNFSSPKEVFLEIVEHCWKTKTEIPSYFVISNIITKSYNYFENKSLSVLSGPQYKKSYENLCDIIYTKESLGTYTRSPVTILKNMSHSTRAMNLKNSAEEFLEFKKHFEMFQPLYDALNLSDQTIQYLSSWVQKASSFQLQQMGKRKAPLYLLGFIKHQFYIRHDLLMDVFLKLTQSLLNRSSNQNTKEEQKTKSERKKTIQDLSKLYRTSEAVIEGVTNLLNNSDLKAPLKVESALAMLIQYKEQKSKILNKDEETFSKALSSMEKNDSYFNALEKSSPRIKRKIDIILKTIIFDEETSYSPLLEAVERYQIDGGILSRKTPLAFLSDEEKSHVLQGNHIKPTFYRPMLFMHIFNNVKAGQMNLKYSYRYKAIQDYLIPQKEWDEKKDSLLKEAEMSGFLDCEGVLSNFKTKLNNQYHAVNERILLNENPHITFDEEGSFKINTPGTDYSKDQYIPSLMESLNYVPIQQILKDIDKLINFSDCFKHFSIKHHKLSPTPDIIHAGIIGKGCNIGIHKLGSISKGVSMHTLKNTVNWFFSLKNIHAANGKILKLVNKLSLPNEFRHSPTIMHTGSDGRKINVSVECIHAAYSFKYFGKGKGVTLYSFLDERQLLYYSNIMSSAERESNHVIDGILQNEWIQSNIHSTDTHGFTELIFAASHFTSTFFAPRFKKIQKQKIYGFSNRSSYKKLGYKLLPSRTINQKIIKKHWDDILRFMVTIKLKRTPAHQLFKRLSSYAKDHPLYKALKEFGRIQKSLYILEFLDDVPLRQRVEKQLNKVELSNKFSKAVAFANNQEFKSGSKEEQEIISGCSMLIQNAIVLWNYLYLSKLIINLQTLAEKQHMIEQIKKGSILVWSYVNFQGQYDFSVDIHKGGIFNLKSILALRAS